MKSVKKYLILSFLIFTAAFVFCETKATVTKLPQRLFWRIDGTDRTGKPSVIFVQGTIHVGNDKLFPLADEVVSKFVCANRVVGEISNEEMENHEKAILRRTLLSFKKADGRLVTDYLSAEECETAGEILGKSMFKKFSVFEP
ncbi:MAG: TraB/GumN family protein [Treponema sp.]|nr:TraB/GumN family protein [Treponema sp.]